MRFAAACAILFVNCVARADTTGVDLGPEVRKLVDAWLAAQNGGDFAAYERLYAERFTGVRRSGPRTVRLDRAGWMKDRRRMFGKPMVVAADGLKVASATSSARVGFTQRFQQGSYRDVGEKQLVIVREGGALKIAQEELLRSELVGPARPPVDEALSAFTWVVDGGVLLDGAPDESLAHGRPKLDLGDTVVVRYRVDAKAAPEEARAWIGRKVRLFDAAGHPCETTVKGLSLVGRVIPHFGTRQEWRELSDGKIAKEAWALASKALVGEVEPGCADATWARLAERPVPVITDGEEADAALTAAALSRFRALPAWRALERAYKEDGREGRWDHDQATVRVFHALYGGKAVRLVSVNAASAEGGCADFSGDLWGLWQVEGKRWTLRNQPGEASLVPAAFVDVDGDGTSELLSDGPPAGDFGAERALVHARDGVWNEVDTLGVPYLDCPC